MRKVIVGAWFLVLVLVCGFEATSFADRPESPSVTLWSDPVHAPLNFATLGYCTFLNTHPTATVSSLLTLYALDVENPPPRAMAEGNGDTAPLHANSIGTEQLPGMIVYCRLRLMKQRRTDHIDPQFVRAAFTLYDGNFSQGGSMGAPVFSSPLR